MFSNNLQLVRAFVKAAKRLCAAYDLEPVIKLMGVEGREFKDQIWRRVGLEVFAIYLEEELLVTLRGEKFLLSELPHPQIRECVFKVLIGLLAHNQKHLMKTLGTVIGKMIVTLKTRSADTELKSACLEKLESQSTRISERFFLFLLKLFEFNNSMFFEATILRKELLLASAQIDEKYRILLLLVLKAVCCSVQSSIRRENSLMFMQDLVETVTRILPTAESSVLGHAALLLNTFWRTHGFCEQPALVLVQRKISERLVPGDEERIQLLLSFVESARTHNVADSKKDLIEICKNCLMSTREPNHVKQALEEIFQISGRVTMAQFYQLLSHNADPFAQIKLLVYYITSTQSLDDAITALPETAFNFATEALKMKILTLFNRSLRNRSKDAQTNYDSTFTSARSMLSNVQDKHVFKVLLEGEAEARQEDSVTENAERDDDKSKFAADDFDCRSDASLTLVSKPEVPINITANTSGFVRLNKAAVDLMPLVMKRQYDKLFQRRRVSEVHLPSGESGLAALINASFTSKNSTAFVLFIALFAHAFQGEKLQGRKGLLAALVDIAHNAFDREQKLYNILSSTIYAIFVQEDSWALEELDGLSDKLPDAHLKLMVGEELATRGAAVGYQPQRVNRPPELHLSLSSISSGST